MSTVKKSTKFKRSIVQEANELVNGERPDKYGFVGVSMPKIAQMATLMCTEEELHGGIITPQMCLKVMRSFKLIRDTYTPDNPDHLRDDTGYAELVDQCRQLGI